MYPLLYTQQPSYANTPYGMVPLLSYERDAPGRLRARHRCLGRLGGFAGKIMSRCIRRAKNHLTQPRHSKEHSAIGSFGHHECMV